MDILLNMNRRLRIGILFSSFVLSILIMPFVGDFWFIFFTLSFLSIGLLIYTNLKYDKQLQVTSDALFKKLLVENEFIYDDAHIGDDKLSGIAINESNHQIAILNRTNLDLPFNFMAFSFSDIIESAIVEDGETIIRSSKGSLVGGAIVGGMIAGGVGSVVGALGGSKTSNETVKRISLHIVVDSLLNPIYEINYLNTITSISKNDMTYKEVYNNANKWHKMISVILKRNEINIMKV